MTENNNLEKDNGIVILYFSNKVCAACDVIHKKIEVMLKSYTNIKIIDIVGEENLELVAEYNVFSYPLIVVV